MDNTFNLSLPGWAVATLIAVAVLTFLTRKQIAWWLISGDLEMQKLLSQKKSSEVRVGKLTETLAPLSELFPVDISKPGTSTTFLGQPIDYIHFDPSDGITFIEVKSNSSKLSQSQSALKRLIEQKRVFWREVNIKG